MLVVCFDLEGVLMPEVWINVAEKTGIEELRRTTRDEPDYDKLMRYRLDILDEHGITIDDIQQVIATMDPLPGAKEFLDEVGGVDAPAELGVVQHGFLERDGGLDSLDDVLVECPVHFVHGIAAAGAEGDQLGDHGVVMGRDGVAGVGVAVEAHAASAGGEVHINLAGAGTEVIPRILGIDAALYGVATDLDVAL